MPGADVSQSELEARAADLRRQLAQIERELGPARKASLGPAFEGDADPWAAAAAKLASAKAPPPKAKAPGKLVIARPSPDYIDKLKERENGGDEKARREELRFSEAAESKHGREICTTVRKVSLGGDSVKSTTSVNSETVHFYIGDDDEPDSNGNAGKGKSGKGEPGKGKSSKAPLQLDFKSQLMNHLQVKLRRPMRKGEVVYDVNQAAPFVASITLPALSETAPPRFVSTRCATKREAEESAARIALEAVRAGRAMLHSPTAAGAAAERQADKDGKWKHDAWEKIQNGADGWQRSSDAAWHKSWDEADWQSWSGWDSTQNSGQEPAWPSWQEVESEAQGMGATKDEALSSDAKTDSTSAACTPGTEKPSIAREEAVDMDAATVARLVDYLQSAQDVSRAKKTVLHPKSGVLLALAEAAIRIFDAQQALAEVDEAREGSPPATSANTGQEVIVISDSE